MTGTNPVCRYIVRESKCRRAVVPPSVRGKLLATRIVKNNSRYVGGESNTKLVHLEARERGGDDQLVSFDVHYHRPGRSSAAEDEQQGRADAQQ